MVLKRQLWIVCVLPWFGRTVEAFGAKERKLGFVYAVRARYGPALTSSDVFGVVVMVSWPSIVSTGPEEAIVDCVCFDLVRPHSRGI